MTKTAASAFHAVHQDSALEVVSNDRPLSQSRNVGRFRAVLKRAKTTLDAGESLWTLALILALDVIIVVPIFLMILGLAVASIYIAT